MYGPYDGLGEYQRFQYEVACVQVHGLSRTGSPGGGVTRCVRYFIPHSPAPYAQVYECFVGDTRGDPRECTTDPSLLVLHASPQLLAKASLRPSPPILALCSPSPLSPRGAALSIPPLDLSPLVASRGPGAQARHLHDRVRLLSMADGPVRNQAARGGRARRLRRVAWPRALGVLVAA